MEQKKNAIYKRWWFWVILVIVLICIPFAFNVFSSEETEVETTKVVHNKDAEEDEDDTLSEDDTSEDEGLTDSEDDDISSEDSDWDSDTSEESDPTAGMDYTTQNAFRSAVSYLEGSGFSKQGLIDQLSSEYGSGYTLQQATDAVQALEDAGLVDWNEQAVRSAEEYLEYSSFSRQGLIDQLSSEYGSQYTVAQATYAADQVGLK